MFSRAIYRAARRNRGVYGHILGDKMAVFVRASQILFSIPPVSHRLKNLVRDADNRRTFLEKGDCV